jgi:hypothetical protein
VFVAEREAVPSPNCTIILSGEALLMALAMLWTIVVAIDQGLWSTG